MQGIKSSTRLALTIGVVGATIFWVAADFGIFPSPVDATLDGRVDLAKTVAINASNAVENGRLHDFDESVARIIATNHDVVSIGLKRANGQFRTRSGNHESLWQKDEFPDSCRIETDIYNGRRRWGELQILFNPRNRLASSVWFYPITPAVYLFCSLSFASWCILGRTFRYLNPSNVVPNRVRSALDTLTEGLVLIDPKGEIVHTNKAFEEMVGMEAEDLVGAKLAQQDWEISSDDIDEMPWELCLASEEPIRGKILELRARNNARKYIVNSSPVYGGGDKLRGAIISFDDVTVLEAKKTELADMILTLRQSRDEVARQNKELYFLANCDPLTMCFNRRSFWNQYNEMWSNLEQGKLNLIMVDLDHFKSINDTYGHSVGDAVLKECGALLREVIGDDGFVCRYGGEEFVILLGDMEFEGAIQIANSVLCRVRESELGGISVTTSIGVSNTSLGAMDMQHLLDQADQCLYAAKRNGRNQVVRYDECDLELSEVGDSEDTSISLTSMPINYSTVTGLLSALAFKCQKTAEHSVRVADLCVAVGQRLLGKHELYRLEVCGLLHDIGKIGVPDHILNKPGPLTDKEWAVMRNHDDYGVAIVRSAFGSEDMANIIKCHQDSFTATSMLTDSISPMEARIITACDAFDSMIEDRVYRKALPLEEAIAELRRCTPDQFDPVVVDTLIGHVSQAGFGDSRKVALSTSTKAAVAIAKHLEDLHAAVASENVRELQEVVQGLKDEAELGGIGVITDAANRLEEAITTDDAQLSQVMELAEDVMQLCRSTRQSIVATNAAAQSAL